MDSYIQNYRTGKFLLIEWKCRGKRIQFPQTEIIQTIHTSLKNSGNSKYSGYVCVRLSSETPADSADLFLSGDLKVNGEWKIYKDRKITESELTKLLKLDWG